MQPRFFPRNWELLPRGKLVLGEQARFVNVRTGASLKVEIPPQYGRLVTSFYGCLILEDKSARRMRLLNPVTMAVRDLPYHGASAVGGASTSCKTPAIAPSSSHD